jgi:low affinity Fe/Cu permease
MFCSHCGHQLPQLGRFCHGCGQPLLGNQLTVATPPLPIQTTQQVRPLPPKIPWFLRWYVIIPVFFLWPAWYLPAGALAAFGLILMRIKTVPASRAKLGWLFILAAIPILLVSIIGLLAHHDAAWVIYTIRATAIVSMLFLAYGFVILKQARKARKLINAIDKQKLRDAAEVAHAIGREDVAAVSKEIHQIIKRGWLNGYQYDLNAQKIVLVEPSFNIFRIMWRSWLGTAFLFCSFMLLSFAYFIGDSPSSGWSSTPFSGEAEYQRREGARKAREWKENADSHERLERMEREHPTMGR